MEALNVVVAAVASYAFGAAWYMTLAKPWAKAAGIEMGEDGKPVNDGPLPYVIAFVSSVIVAGMMRHVFASSGVDTVWEGFVSGAGVGLFLATPWMLTFYAFGNRPKALMLIDGGYATIGSAIMGIILTLF